MHEIKHWNLIKYFKQVLSKVTNQKADLKTGGERGWSSEGRTAAHASVIFFPSLFINSQDISGDTTNSSQGWHAVCLLAVTQFRGYIIPVVFAMT